MNSNDKPPLKLSDNATKSFCALKYLQEGLITFLDVQVKAIHSRFINYAKGRPDVSLVCSSCHLESLMPDHALRKSHCTYDKCNCRRKKKLNQCPAKICGIIYDLVVDEHSKKDPLWVGVDASKWTTNHWEIGKCYLGKRNENATSAFDIDAPGLLTICINSRIISKSISNINNFYRAKEARNLIVHSSTFEFEDKDVEKFIKRFKKVLKDEKCLVHDSNAAAAVSKLEKLRNAQITPDDERLANTLTASLHIKGDNTAQTEHVRLKGELMKDLMMFNRAHHSTIPVTPLIMENQVSLAFYYVKPTLNVIQNHQSSFDSPATRSKSLVKSLRDIFYKQNKLCNEIYLTAEAGLGKTVYGKWLVLAWCNAMYPNSDQHDITSEDLEILRQFEFVFLVPIRDVSGQECDIDRMIYTQIISQLARSGLYTFEFMQEVLSESVCLMILDGFDEWMHPLPGSTDCRLKDAAVPHRKQRANCTILTTTRPWKLDVSNIKVIQIDKQLELSGIDEDASKQLIANVGMLKDDCELAVSNHMHGFQAELDKRKLKDLQSVPLVLMHLICLWCDEEKLGDSRCEIYSNIVKLNLIHLNRKHEIENETPSDIETEDVQNVVTEQYHDMINGLARLAFVTLFSTNKEKSLVFSTATAASVLGKSNLELALKSGLLTQNTKARKLTKKISEIAFSHKTFQEYFTALYIKSLSETSTEIETVCQTLQSVSSILEYGNVFVFLCGICQQKANHIMKELSRVILCDEDALKYMSNGSLVTYWSDTSTMKDVQDTCVAALLESLENTKDQDVHVHIPLFDIFINTDETSERYLSSLKILIERNCSHVRSLHINGTDGASLGEILITYGIQNMINLQRIDIWAVVKEEDLDNLIVSSRETLRIFMLHPGSFVKNRWQESFTKISTVSFSSMLGLTSLETISLWDLHLTHDQLRQLSLALKNNTSMKQIGLGDMHCVDHMSCKTCDDLNLDLSLNVNLRNLQINLFPFSTVILPNTIEECVLGAFHLQGVLRSVFDSLKQSRSLSSLTCFELKDDHDICTMLYSVPELTSLKSLYLNRIDLGNRMINIGNQMKRLELLKLKRVSLTTNAFVKLIDTLRQLKHTVTVDMVGCTVSSSEEFEKLVNLRDKTDITVVEHSVDQWKRSKLIFRNRPAF